MNDSMAQTHHDGGIELAAIADAGHDTPANVGDAGNENGEPHNDAGSLLPPPARTRLRLQHQRRKPVISP